MPRLSKRIRDLKKIKKSEQKLIKITKEIDELANSIKNKKNRGYFKKQVLWKSLRASDVYGRSLENTKGFLHYITNIIKKELIPLKKLIKDYIYVEQGLEKIIKTIDDRDTQIPLMNKKLLKLELDSLYKMLSRKNVYDITKEYKKITKTFKTDEKNALKKINDYKKRISEDVKAIENLLIRYGDQLAEQSIKQLKQLRHDFIKLRGDVDDSRYIEGKLLAKEHVLYDIKIELESIHKRAIPVNAIKMDAADTIENIGRMDDSSEDYASQVREIKKLSNTLTDQNINDTYRVINHYKQYHILKPPNEDDE